jgi:hypothetical protein
MEKITFKQYVESKHRLHEAAKKTPKQNIQYIVHKYCKLVVGENKEEKQYVSLRPNYSVHIEWLYEDIDNPTPVNITVTGSNKISPSQELHAIWPTYRLQKWLQRNTRELMS